jgi:hypothetical protein
VEGSCEHGNEPSGSIKCWEVLEWLRDWRLLKKSQLMELVMHSDSNIIVGVSVYSPRKPRQ